MQEHVNKEGIKMCRMIYKTGMRIFTIVTALIFSAILVGCDTRNDGVVSDDSLNAIGILSPDGSQIAFIRHFNYNRNYTSNDIFTAITGHEGGR